MITPIPRPYATNTPIPEIQLSLRTVLVVTARKGPIVQESDATA